MFSKKLCALMLNLCLLLIATPVWAGEAQNKKPLSEKENPLLIGKRDLNKGQIQFYSLEKEQKIGAELAAELLRDRQVKFIDDPVITEYVNRVGQNIVLNSDAKVPFTIKVVESQEVNAFALPGGYFYVNAGLILAADNEAQLAGVMAHEIAHVAARHGAEQASKGTLLQYASIPLIFLGGIGGMVAQNAAGLLVPLTFLKFSRGAEEEADRLGAQYAWKAGYDPREMLTFFEKLQAKEKRKPGTISKLFMSHPTNDKRIEKVQSLVTRFPEQNEYVVNTSEFSRIKERLQQVTKTSFTESEEKRPTLKRRSSSEDKEDKDPVDERKQEESETEQPKDAPGRPTLRKQQ